MSEVITYYLKSDTLTEEHKRHISQSMIIHYSLHPMTIEHRRKISEGAKRAWAERKEYWREQGWI